LLKGHSRVIFCRRSLGADSANAPVTPENTVSSVFRLLGLDLDHFCRAKVIEETAGINQLFT
jgi:hypothetical protein